MARKEKEEDVDTLKRRGRRRLVGAVALVLLAVIVLPMVFDPEPRKAPPPVSVRIPGEDETPFTPKVTPKPVPEKKVEEKKVEEKKAAEAPKPVPAPPPEPKKAVVEKKAPETERARAEAAIGGGEFVVQVGVFANPKDAVAKLAGARIPYYTEAAGNLTRVRAGPFATKAEAEKALQALKAMGLKPGNVTTKS